MMDELAMIILDENAQEDRRNLRIFRRNIRDAIDPFQIPEGEFRRLYRFNRDGVLELIRLLDPYLLHSNRPEAIAPHFQVLSALNFLSSGSYQAKVGQDFLACISQSSVSNILHRVVDGLNELMDDWVKFPTTQEEVEAIQMRFWEKHQFPGVIGLIDGTHIAIVPLESEREHIFINRKGYHSLNVLIVCDADSKITFVNASHGGRTHDSRVFLASLLSQHLHVEHQNGARNRWLLGKPPYPNVYCIHELFVELKKMDSTTISSNDNYGVWKCLLGVPGFQWEVYCQISISYRDYHKVLLGDSGYPSLPYFLTPKVNQEEGTPGWRYTRHHVQIRSKVERTIGLIQGPWRCLRKDRALHYSPEFSGRIVNACCVLHNMKQTWRLQDENDVYHDQMDLVEPPDVLHEEDIEDDEDGIAVREAIINHYFAQVNQ